MDAIERELATRRKFIASKSRLSLYPDTNIESNMTDYNSKVDLRPTWMINDNDLPSGKPHVNSVLQPEQRALGIPRSIPTLTALDLQRAALKRTGNRLSIDREGLRTVEDLSTAKLNINIQSAPKTNVFDFQVSSNDTAGNHSPTPPPPPPPPSYDMQKLHGTKVPKGLTYDKPVMRKESYPDPQDVNFINGMDERDIEIKQLRLQLEALSSNERKPTVTANRNSTTIEPPQYVRNANNEESWNSRPRRDSAMTPAAIEAAIEQRFDERDIGNPSMKRWIKQLVENQFESLSTIEPSKPTVEPSISETIREARSRDEEIDKNGRSRSRSRETKKSSRSRQTSRDGSPNSVKSMSRSIKSVLFSRTEEEELYSDVDDDDIVDLNAGNTGFIDHTSDKFTIHGPFVDRELNVFHAICSEYQSAARMSFARRTPFARTNPAHQRVYALLGSNRRSGWTNRNSWNDAANSLQLLDYLFRRIIRSKTQKIKQPVMELEHYSAGRTLDTQRFYQIIRAVFKKRNRLTDVLKVNVDEFENIK